jgi:hypothetical protein
MLQLRHGSRFFRSFLHKVRNTDRSRWSPTEASARILLSVLRDYGRAYHKKKVHSGDLDSFGRFASPRFFVGPSGFFLLEKNGVSALDAGSI